MIWKNEDKKPVYIGINTNIKGSANSVKFLCNAWRQLITGHTIEKYDHFVGITEAKPICDYKKTLFDYYKNAVHGMISWWEENKKAINQATLEFEVKDNYTYNRIKSNQDRICKISNIIGGLKDEYRIVANTIKSL